MLLERKNWGSISQLAPASWKSREVVDPLGHVFTKQLWPMQALVWGGKVTLSRGHNPPQGVKKSQHKPDGGRGNAFREVSSRQGEAALSFRGTEELYKALPGLPSTHQREKVLTGQRPERGMGITEPIPALSCRWGN